MMKATHTTVRNMSQNVESAGHKVLWTNFSLPTCFDDLRDQKNKCMHDSATQTKGHSPDFRLKK
jgi:hypothetical protein